MVTLTVLCEGPTEVNFVTQVLRPHLETRNVFSKATSLGGGLTWRKLKQELNLVLRQRRAHEWATTMFDLYKLMRVPDCPNLHGLAGEAKGRKLEESMREGLPNPNFIPYVQIHEFEALLYVDLAQLSAAFPNGEADRAIRILRAETADLAPEEINEGGHTSPSKRLIREIPGYKSRKITAGPLVAEEIGISALRAGCPHFDAWVTRLEGLGC